jgi:hypothetical protein
MGRTNLAVWVQTNLAFLVLSVAFLPVVGSSLLRGPGALWDSGIDAIKGVNTVDSLRGSRDGSKRWHGNVWSYREVNSFSHVALPFGGHPYLPCLFRTSRGVSDQADKA